MFCLFFLNTLQFRYLSLTSIIYTLRVLDETLDSWMIGSNITHVLALFGNTGGEIMVTAFIIYIFQKMGCQFDIATCVYTG